MKKMPIIFDMTFNSEGDREVLHTIRVEIRDLVNKTLDEGKRIVPTFKRDGTAVFRGADGEWFTRRAVKTGKEPLRASSPWRLTPTPARHSVGSPRSPLR